MPLRLCKVCSMEPAEPRKQRCWECELSTKPVVDRVAAAEARLSLVPEECRRQRVPESDWPPGRRFCSGCQTFVRIGDCPKDGSRCKTCTGIAAHASMLQSTYGIDKDTYSRLMNLQGGRCAICRNPPRKARLSMDHDHRTNENRGLLCSRCNDELLGAAYHKIEILRNAIFYLANPPLSGRWQQPEILDGTMPSGQIPY